MFTGLLLPHLLEKGGPVFNLPHECHCSIDTTHHTHTHTHTPSLSLSLLSLSLPLCPSAPGPLHEHDDLTPYLFLGGELGPCFLLSLLHLNIDFGAEKHCG